jgi:hypothetical protein
MSRSDVGDRPGRAAEAALGDRSAIASVRCHGEGRCTTVVDGSARGRYSALCRVPRRGHGTGVGVECNRSGMG